MSVNILIVLFAFTFFIKAQAKYGCPGAVLAFNSGNACSCTSVWIAADYAYKTVVNCVGYAEDPTKFAEALKTLDNYEIDDLVINGYRSVRLPDDVLSKTIVNRIIIINSLILQNFGFKDTGKTFFQNLGQSLETLVIYNVPNIRDEEWKLLSDSLASTGEPYLKNLILCVNPVPTYLNPTDFSSLTGLEKITWRNMGVNYLNETTLDFSIFPKLRLLDLSENRLKYFNPVALPISLTTVYLFTNVDLIGFNQVFFNATKDKIDYVNVKNPNSLDCSCDSIPENMIGSAEAYKFDGICAKPPIMRGKKYGPECWDTSSKTIISGNSSSLLRKTRFIRTKIN